MRQLTSIGILVLLTLALAPGACRPAEPPPYQEGWPCGSPRWEYCPERVGMKERTCCPMDHSCKEDYCVFTGDPDFRDGVPARRDPASGGTSPGDSGTSPGASGTSPGASGASGTDGKPIKQRRGDGGEASR